VNFPFALSTITRLPRHSKVLRQPRANDYLQELAVDLADSFREWRENSLARTCRPAAPAR
jgi:hypothetical protein